MENVCWIVGCLVFFRENKANISIDQAENKIHKNRMQTDAIIKQLKSHQQNHMLSSTNKKMLVLCYFSCNLKIYSMLEN